jgi:septum site-determining protein MinD
MPGDVLTIAGGKGGVGKTTTAINAGVALQEAGYDTIIVDADLGMTNIGDLLGIDHEPSFHDVLAGEASLIDATVEGPNGISVLAGENSLEAFARGDPSNLRRVVHSLAESYEVVIVDTGAGLNHETAVPMGLADGVVLVSTPDEVSLTDAKKAAELAGKVDGEVLGTVVARAGPDTDAPTVSDELGITVLAAVPEDTKTARNEPVVGNAADSLAAQPCRTLAEKPGNMVSPQPSQL